jgi:hypothetical protein
LLHRRGGGKCATIVLAIGVRGLVEALNAGLTQHHETAVKFCQLVFAQNGFRIRSARHEKQDIIFAFCSLFERDQRKAALIVVH